MENFKRPENNHKCCRQQDQSRCLAGQDLLMAFHTKLVNAPISIVCKALFQKAFSMPVPLFSKGLFPLLRTEHEIIDLLFGWKLSYNCTMAVFVTISYNSFRNNLLHRDLHKKIKIKTFLLIWIKVAKSRNVFSSS